MTIPALQQLIALTHRPNAQFGAAPPGRDRRLSPYV